MTGATDGTAVIVPFHSAAGVTFGTPRAEIRARFGTPSHSQRSAQSGDELTDWYLDDGLVVGYGDDGGVDQIQLIGPARPEVDGCAVFAASSQAVLAAIEERGLEVRPALGLWEIPAWGVSLFVQGDVPGERPFDAVTAFAHGPAPEPEFFDAPAPESVTATEVGAGGFGPVRLGMARGSVRALLGEGMAVAVPHRAPADVHFGARVTVTYDQAGAARRICVAAPGVTAAGTQAGVGRSYAECVALLREAGVAFEEGEAEIRLPGTGLRLVTARTGDAALPVTAVIAERAPGS